MALSALTYIINLPSQENDRDYLCFINKENEAREVVKSGYFFKELIGDPRFKNLTFIFRQSHM